MSRSMFRYNSLDMSRCMFRYTEAIYIAGDVQWSEALPGSPSRALPKAGQGAAAVVEGESF